MNFIRPPNLPFNQWYNALFFYELETQFRNETSLPFTGALADNALNHLFEHLFRRSNITFEELKNAHTALCGRWVVDNFERIKSYIKQNIKLNLKVNPYYIKQLPLP